MNSGHYLGEPPLLRQPTEVVGRAGCRGAPTCARRRAHVDGHARGQRYRLIIDRPSFWGSRKRSILIGTQVAAAKHEPAAAAKKAPVHQWTVDDVCAFFAAQKLGEYNATIEENGVDGLLLEKTVERHALGSLGITNAFHVIKIEVGLAKIAQHLDDGSVAEAVVSCTSLLCVRLAFSTPVPCSSHSARPSTSAATAARRALRRMRLTWCSPQ